jgi:hypothetical protein
MVFQYYGFIACTSSVTSYSRPSSHGVQRIGDKKMATQKAVGRALNLCILGIILQGVCAFSLHLDRTWKSNMSYTLLFDLISIYV